MDNFRHCESLMDAAKKCRKMRLTCSAKIALYDVEDIKRRFQQWQQWHQSWVYGDPPGKLPAILFRILIFTQFSIGEVHFFGKTIYPAGSFGVGNLECSLEVSLFYQ